MFAAKDVDGLLSNSRLESALGLEAAWRRTLQHTDNGGRWQATFARKVYCWKK
jgi:hypothetical protein